VLHSLPLLAQLLAERTPPQTTEVRVAALDRLFSRRQSHQVTCQPVVCRATQASSGA